MPSVGCGERAAADVICGDAARTTADADGRVVGGYGTCGLIEGADASLANLEVALNFERARAVPIQGTCQSAFADDQVAGAFVSARNHDAESTADGERSVAVAAGDVRIRLIRADSQGADRASRAAAECRVAVVADK